MTNTVTRDKTEQINQARNLINDISSGLQLVEPLGKAIDALCDFQQSQTSENKEKASAALLSLAEMLTNFSTEVRVARGNILRP